MKIYSFDGKKRFTDNLDDDFSPLWLGQKFVTRRQEDEPAEENDEIEEKPIEN